MKKRALLILMVLSMGSLVVISGCPEPPAGMVKHGNGYAWDANKDGIADVDAQGNVLFVPGSQLDKPAAVADRILPTALTVIGSAAGIPILVGIGRAWGKWKFGKVLVNTLMTVQAARKKLNDGKNAEALAIVTTELSKQLPETKKMIADLKFKNNIESIDSG